MVLAHGMILINTEMNGICCFAAFKRSCDNYRPQTKFAKVMFLQVSVILSTGGGACVVAPGGACVVALGGHAWFLGGMHGFFDEIWSMSGWYASYWNAFLFP